MHKQAIGMDETSSGPLDQTLQALFVHSIFGSWIA